MTHLVVWYYYALWCLPLNDQWSKICFTIFTVCYCKMFHSCVLIQRFLGYEGVFTLITLHCNLWRLSLASNYLFLCFFFHCFLLEKYFLSPSFSLEGAGTLFLPFRRLWGSQILLGWVQGEVKTWRQGERELEITALVDQGLGEFHALGDNGWVDIPLCPSFGGFRHFTIFLN